MYAAWIIHVFIIAQIPGSGISPFGRKGAADEATVIETNRLNFRLLRPSLANCVVSRQKTFTPDIIARMPDAHNVHETLTALLRHKTPGSQIIIGLAGGSGSGKSTVAQKIKAGLAGLKVERIALDRFFKPEAEMPRYWSDYHHAERPHYNHPDLLKVDEMVAFCDKIAGFDVVLLDGHFCLYYPAMRRLMDVKCSVDIDLDEMLERRTLPTWRKATAAAPKISGTTTGGAWGRNISAI